jgi:hypothetical protein
VQKEAVIAYKENITSFVDLNQSETFELAIPKIINVLKVISDKPQGMLAILSYDVQSIMF